MIKANPFILLGIIRYIARVVGVLIISMIFAVVLARMFPCTAVLERLFVRDFRSIVDTVVPRYVDHAHSDDDGNDCSGKHRSSNTLEACATTSAHLMMMCCYESWNRCEGSVVCVCEYLSLEILSPRERGYVNTICSWRKLFHNLTWEIANVYPTHIAVISGYCFEVRAAGHLDTHIACDTYSHWCDPFESKHWPMWLRRSSSIKAVSSLCAKSGCIPRDGIDLTSNVGVTVLPNLVL